jgi:hypothetical protein
MKRREDRLVDLSRLQSVFEFYSSLVEDLPRALMKSRTADSAYLTALPIFTKRGPVPVNLDFASQLNETFSNLATSFECSRGSSGLALFAAFMSPPFESWRWLNDAGKTAAKIAISYAKIGRLIGESDDDLISTSCTSRSSLPTHPLKATVLRLLEQKFKCADHRVLAHRRRAFSSAIHLSGQRLNALRGIPSSLRDYIADQRLSEPDAAWSTTRLAGTFRVLRCAPLS